MEKEKIIQVKEKIFTYLLIACQYSLIVLLAGILITLVINCISTLASTGISFIYNLEWNPVEGKFGALPFVVGTLLTSFLALIISIPFSVAIGIFLGEYLKEGIISNILKSMVELLAAIPSIIYGFWAIYYLIPIVRNLEIMVGAEPYGVGILSASLVLSIMIIPYSASIAREVITMAPPSLKEAAYSLGGTRFEVIRFVILPFTRSGILAGILLSLGRAIGETMAVTMVIGNSNYLPQSIFAPGNTMASVIANEFSEASSDMYLSALVEIGLLLFIITTIINVIGTQIINRLAKL